MALSSTQIGAIAETLVANELMIHSEGRLSPFSPIADDDGIDILIFDKQTGTALPLQVKARTRTLQGGNTVHFEVRKRALRETRHGMLLCLLLDPDLRGIARTWIVPFSHVPTVASERAEKYVLRPSRAVASRDRYRHFQCETMAELANRVLKAMQPPCDSGKVHA
ncbi:MAG TPA: hypothetical protein VF210_04785 [Pseudomonadales bacterium]